MITRFPACAALVLCSSIALGACGSPDLPGSYQATGGAVASFPLTLVADVDLPGKAVRFDYQDVDGELDHLVIAHMNTMRWSS